MRMPVVSSFCVCVSPRETRRTAAAAPSQQQIRRSSRSVAAAALSQRQLYRSSSRLYKLALKWSSHRRVPSRGAAELAASSTSKRDASCSCCAASAPSQPPLVGKYKVWSHRYSRYHNLYLGFSQIQPDTETDTET